MDVLILNTTYEPHQILNQHKALKLIIRGRGEVIRALDGCIHGMNADLPRPSVIRLKTYIKYYRQPVAFSKENVLKRDRYMCQYCGLVNKSREDKMTVDHVIPKHKNGDNSFENVVACCMSCNAKKANLDLHETNMTLLRKPKRPSALVFMKTHDIRPEWAEFMFF